jgi:hypothetical protein
MKKLTLLLMMLAVLALPARADAGRFVVRGGCGVQTPPYWHPFFYPGPFAYGYPGSFTYAYPGPYVTSGDPAPYTYGYPGPYSYGTWTYSRPQCFSKPDGYWVCR